MIRWVWLLLLATGCGLWLSGCATNGGNQTKQPPPPANVIAYLHRSGIPNSYIIYDLKVLRSDGSLLTPLASLNLLSAVLSPDGTKILYSYFDPNAGYQVATINPDGSGKTVLTAPGSFQLYPRYTPDGSKIVFQASGSLARSIGVMNADGSNPQIINAGVGNQYCFPASNGISIANSELVLPSQGLATMAMDGSNQQLLQYSAYFSYPAFSSDGNTIIFSTSDGRNENLYSISTTGANLKQLTNSQLNWDPLVTNGKIYFVSSSKPNPAIDDQQIFSINPDGSGLTAVTNDTLYDGFRTANGLCLNP